VKPNGSKVPIGTRFSSVDLHDKMPDFIMFALGAYSTPANAGGPQDFSPGHTQTKTANFVYYTIEVPDRLDTGWDWKVAGRGQDIARYRAEPHWNKGDGFL
jgi:hypothetical protein